MVHNKCRLSTCTYKVCSKKDRTFAIKTLFYILSTVPFKLVPSTGDTPFPTFLPLLECFLECIFCDGAQFPYRIFLNLRVFKKRPNVLNSLPTRTEGALLMLIVKRGEWQFVVKPCRWVRSVAVVCPLCWLVSYLKSLVFFLNRGVHW